MIMRTNEVPAKPVKERTHKFRPVFTGLRTIIVQMGIGLLFIAGCSKADSAPDDVAARESSVPVPSTKVVNVRAAQVQRSAFMDFIHITSSVEAYQDVTVSAEESGVITKYFVDKGAVLRRGQAIAKLKDDVLVTRLAEAQAAADLAREQFKRQKVLWQRDNIGSELAYLQAKSRYDATNARVNLLKIRLSNTTLKAPISGIFEEKYLDIGEMATPGQPIIRLINTDRVRIIGGVPERYALFVHPGDSAWITFDFLPGQQYAGLINFVGNAVNAGSRTFPIEIVLDNPHRSIKPQMVAGVNLVREQFDNVITVPQQIIMRLEDGYQLYVAQEFQGKLVAAARKVQLGPNYENRVVIREGLEVGELIITLGYQQVDHGTPVRVINAGSLAFATEESSGP